MKKIKTAIIGANKFSHAASVVKSIRDQNDIFDITGYALPENERKKFPEIMIHYEGLKELTLDEILNNNEIEAVVIETEEINLTKYALLAAKCGKHIHMEKPGGISLTEFEKLIETMRKTGKVFHTGYMYRYNPCVQKLMKQIKNGELGDIISVEAQMNCWHKRDVRQWLGNFPGGMMFYLGCHLIDLILQLQGMPENIIPLNRCSQVDSVTSDDFGMVIFEYKNSVSFAKTSAVEVGGYARRQLVVTGTKASVEIKPFEQLTAGGHKTIVTEYRSPLEWKDAGTAYDSGTFARYDNMMASFARMVRGEMENPWTYDYELMLYKTILKCCGGENNAY